METRIKTSGTIAAISKACGFEAATRRGEGILLFFVSTDKMPARRKAGTARGTLHETSSLCLRHLRYELILSGAYDKEGGPLLYLLEPHGLGFNSRLA